MIRHAIAHYRERGSGRTSNEARLLGDCARISNPEVIDFSFLFVMECPLRGVLGLEFPLCWELQLLCQPFELGLIADGVISGKDKQ